MHIASQMGIHTFMLTQILEKKVLCPPVVIFNLETYCPIVLSIPTRMSSSQYSCGVGVNIGKPK